MIKKLQHISYYLIASLLLLVACDKESHPITPEEPQEQYAISMDAVSVADMTSRAIITKNEDLQAVSLGIYGYKQVVDGTKTLIFNNTELSYTNGWDYSPKKYWDRTAHYYFVGYAPHGVTTSYKPDENTLTISNIPYWQPIDGNETDYLVANSDDTAEGYLSTETKSVGLEFSHILSQFVVKIVKEAALSDVEYKLTKVEYINVPVESAKATYTYKPVGTSSYSDISITSSSSTVSMFSGEKEVTQYSSDNTLSHLVVPFTLSGANKVQIKVTYTIVRTERSKTVDTQIASLNAGKCNELTLTFKGSEIIPSLSVKDWQNVEITEDPKYNW